ncbi:hypothetical protein MF271_22340 (plasmid) [Deinococcus sp. KNUC1210]|uniref:hypothetical protein n=1 Tax=Deinococcus sp. KNUC1210 TaxID=2917691 RepID=UPI001EEFD981|nr:hypothetical protein [Deinococcus sp. KNUC1210]ULH18212.1 hypothetical protein MF271_22340 [Deinococcus sp. KNUC1210]
MQYLAIFEQDGPAFGGLVPELNVTVVGKTQEQVRERLAQRLALAVLERQRAGLPVPAPRFQTLSDLPAADLADFAQPHGELLAAAEVNPVSLEVERAIERSGLSNSEVARRIGSSPAAVGRLQDYFYWGHSLTTLRKLAEVLGAQLEVKLTQSAA